MNAHDGDVVDHYGLGGLRARIEAALTSRDSQQPLTERDLSGAAEFHIGGRAASQYLIEQLRLGPSHSVLDVGCGIGGTARLIAATTGAHVHGIDLTPEFVEVASWLSDLTGLSDRTRFEVDSATGPLRWRHHFDAATMLHVGMNIADKNALAATVHSVLRPGGRFAIYDVMAGVSDEPLAFPVPWAASLATSHVAPASAYVAALERAGFEIHSVEDRSAWARELLGTTARTASALNLSLVMGPETAAKVANMRANLDAERIAPTAIVAIKN